MNHYTLSLVALVALAFTGVISAQDPTTSEPEPSPTTSEATSTAYPGLPYGSFCNGLLARCNRYGETVACLQRRPEPTTTEPAPTTDATESPIVALFQRKTAEEREICETGITVDLGKCQCSRNCKNGIYVDDGEFDEERERCVGLVGSTCTLLVPNCTKNGRCNLLTSKCVCDPGFVNDGNRRCVQA